MKIEFERGTNPEWPCCAQVHFIGRQQWVCACGKTWEEAELNVRAKIAALNEVPPPPEPVEL